MGRRGVNIEYLARVEQAFTQATRPLTVRELANATGLNVNRVKWVLYCSPHKTKYRPVSGGTSTHDPQHWAPFPPTPPLRPGEES